MSDHTAYIRNLRALVDLLEQHPHLPAATWVLDSGRFDGQLNSWQVTLADRRAAIAAWAETLRGVVGLTRYTTSTIDHAGNLSVEGRYLGVPVRVWVGLTGADLLALLAEQAETSQAVTA